MTNWANWGCGKGRVRQCQTSRTESGLRFYTAKRERFRPIRRIGRIGERWKSDGVDRVGIISILGQ